MKHNYSRLCLKERWLSFALCLLLGAIAGGTGIYAYTKHITCEVMCAGLVICVILSVTAIFLFRLNLRRKRIQQEFVNELGKEIRKKEHICPRCGAMMGISSTCRKCGYEGH